MKVKSARTLALKNMKHKPARSLILLSLICLLSITMFGGSLFILSLKNGMNSLEKRLGADIIVVPSSARSKVDLDQVLLNGTTGYFYMDQSVVEKIKEIEGVEMASPQIFLASLRADCCSSAVQVIGIDQETDFSVQPWIEKRFNNSLKEYEVVVGSKVNAQVGENIRIYNQNCQVAARLDSTGTGLDTAVYTNTDNIRKLLQAAEESGHDLKINGDPEEVVSAVYVKVQEGYDIEKVAQNLKIYVRKTEVIQTKSMLTNVADGLRGISNTAEILLGVLWILVFGVLIAAFCLMMQGRKREFSVLRVLGASNKLLTRMLRTETLLLSAIGGTCGILVSGAVLRLFRGLIEARLGMPFLLPNIREIFLAAGLTIGFTLILGFIASSGMTKVLCKVDAGTILREDS
ncbi:MAG: ABC transporter permease [Eubacteriales bacterium]|nr:ABC transporter permease [Eubacteriales bacterium]